jgi:hypothetical protein
MAVVARPVFILQFILIPYNINKLLVWPTLPPLKKSSGKREGHIEQP